MKKHKALVLLFILSLLIGGVSESSAAEDKGPMGHVFAPIFYKEVAPHKGVFGKKGVETKKYFTSAVFKNRETGKTVMSGEPRGSRSMGRRNYALSVISAGHYDLVSFSVGGKQTPYDQKKCGRISFDIADGDVLVFKGPRPVAIDDSGLLKARRVAYVAFETHMAGYESIIRNEHDVPVSKRMTLVDLKSDRPDAFRACVKSVHPNYTTLMNVDGAMAVGR